MKNSLISLSLIGSFTIFTMTINLFDTLAMFVLFGIVPNSSIVLSADTMLTVLSVSVAMFILFLLRSALVTALKQLYSTNFFNLIRSRRSA